MLRGVLITVFLISKCSSNGHFNFFLPNLSSTEPSNVPAHSSTQPSGESPKPQRGLVLASIPPILKSLPGAVADRLSRLMPAIRNGILGLLMSLRDLTVIGLTSGLATVCRDIISFVLARFLHWQSTSQPSGDSMIQDMMRAFHSGFCRPYKGKVLIPRTDLIEKIQQEFSSVGVYHIILGENGVGKSTAVQSAIQGMKERNGVIFFEIKSAVGFAKDLAQVVNFHGKVYNNREALSATTTIDNYLSPDEPFGTWQHLAPALEKAGMLYHDKYKHMMTLVIDGVDKIAKYSVEFLHTLQTFAKDMADQYALRMIFVTSDGTGLAGFFSNSAISRAQISVIPDISDSSAIEYLIQSGMTKAVSEEAVTTMTGGRFSLLIKFLSEFRGCSSLEKIRENWTSSFERAFALCSIAEDHRMFYLLAESLPLSVLTARRLKVGADCLNSLLRYNVLSLKADGTYGFHDRFVQQYFHKRLLLRRKLGCLCC